MRNKPPDDYVHQWSLDQIGRLDKYAFTAEAMSPDSGAYTICFWFYAVSTEAKQVLVNHGNKSQNHEGWSVFIQDGYLVFRVNIEGIRSSDIRVQIQHLPKWQHFSGIIDPVTKRLAGYLDGSPDHWQHGLSGTEFPAGSISPQMDLIIGGYTDPAGGHYDHTFGRNGTGMIDDFRIYKRVLQPQEIRSFIDVENQPPKAVITASPTSGHAPLDVQFDVSQSNDLNGDIHYYLWDFGDGKFGDGVKVKHHYAYAGEYRIRLIVIDDDHGMDTAEFKLVLVGRENPIQIIPVFINGEEGHGCYRIPSIARAANGDLVAFAEGRLESCSDSTKTIRIVSKRSMDNGKTWSPLQVVAQNIIDNEEYVIQNISPVVDIVYGTGRISLVYNKSEYNEWQIAEGKGVCRCFCIYSDDHGKTWQEELDITTMVHKPYNPSYKHIYPDAARPENRDADWRNQRPTLGHAIQLSGTETNPSTRGRLFFVGSFIPGDRGIFNAYNYAFWSDDLGKSWKIGGINDGKRWNSISARGLNEASAVELENGDVMINSRNYVDRVPVGCRAVTLASFDQQGKIQFQPTYHDETLISPSVQASIIRYTHRDQPEFGGKSRILFSNPAHSKARYNLTVRLSYDEGKTWSVSKVVDPGPSAYSDLVIQEDMKIGVLYERGNQGSIYYVNFPLEWITDGRDSLTL